MANPIKVNQIPKVGKYTSPMDPMGDVSSIHRRRIFHPEMLHHEVVSLSSLSRDTEMESPRVCQPRSRSRSHTPQHLGLSNKMLNKMLTKTIV